jgi:hypothetical protein
MPSDRLSEAEVEAFVANVRQTIDRCVQGHAEAPGHHRTTLPCAVGQLRYVLSAAAAQHPGTSFPS